MSSRSLFLHPWCQPKQARQFVSLKWGDKRQPKHVPVLDDEVVSAPRVINPITSGDSQITGNFDIQEAKDLANILQVGKLPAKPEIIEENINFF